MRLLIISHTPHYRRGGEIVGWGPTIREIDELASLFDSVTHIAPLYMGAPPASAVAYRCAGMRLRAVPPAGGERLCDKCGLALRYPGYARAIVQEQRATEVIHVRAPANISLLALVLLAALCQPKLRWAKYAGDWSGGEAESWSYRFQRWWLARGLHRGLVTVNGRWAAQPAHVYSFLNPCLTDAELREGIEASRRKELCRPVRLLFVGRLESVKGAGICLRIVAELARLGIAAQLELVGEGAERQQFEQQARDLRVAGSVRFHGGLPRSELGPFYSQAHFILLPSACSEGWPKVLSEAMAYGAVPIATCNSSIPHFLKEFSTGHAIPALEPRLFSGAIESYLQAPAHWRQHSRNAVKAAQEFSYHKYLQAVRKLLKLPEPSPAAFA